jgi:hypothetical protein
MNDREFDEQARAALATEGTPSERVWRRVHRPEPRWLPTLREIVAATAVGVAVLVALALESPQPRLVAQRPEPPRAGVEGTYVAMTATTIP